MPVIAVNLADVKVFESLPFGSYAGEIEKIVLKEASEAGKFDQFQALYVVIEGELLGRKQSEWLSLSPKAAFRLKRWFAKFGLGDEANLVVDDETLELTSPDLAGTHITFTVKPDRKDPERVRTELFSVDDDVMAPAAPAAVAPVVVKPTAEELAAKAKAERIAAAKAALEALENEGDAAVEVAAPEAAVAVQHIPRAGAPRAAAQPARRTLR